MKHTVLTMAAFSFLLPVSILAGPVAPKKSVTEATSAPKAAVATKSAQRKIAGSDCSFQLREEGDYIFRLMQSEVKGWITCVPKTEETSSQPNVMFVAVLNHSKNKTKDKQPGLSRAQLLDWFSEFESSAVAGEHQTNIMSFQVEKNGQALLEVDSQRSTEVIQHILFTAVSPLDPYESIVFIYTDTFDRMKTYRQNVARMRREFTKRENLVQLAELVKMP